MLASSILILRSSHSATLSKPLADCRNCRGALHSSAGLVECGKSRPCRKPQFFVFWSSAEPCIVPQVSLIAHGPLRKDADMLHSPPRSIPWKTSSRGLLKATGKLRTSAEGVLKAAEGVHTESLRLVCRMAKYWRHKHSAELHRSC